MYQPLAAIEGEIHRHETELDRLEMELETAKEALDASKAYLRSKRERVVAVSMALSDLREAKRILNEARSGY